MAHELPPEQRHHAFAHALQIVRSVPLDLDRVDALGKIATKSDEETRTEVLEDALRLAERLPTSNNRTHALNRVIPILPEEKRRIAIYGALRRARLIEDEYGAFLAIIRLFAELHTSENRQSVLRVALPHAYSIEYIYHCANALVELVPHLEQTE